MKINDAAKIEGTPSEGTIRRHAISGTLDCSKDDRGVYHVTEEALSAAYGIDLKKKAPTGLPADIGDTRPSDVWQNHPERGLTPDRAAAILPNCARVIFFSGSSPNRSLQPSTSLGSGT